MKLAIRNRSRTTERMNSGLERSLPGRDPPVALAAAVIGMLAELLPVDDNFTIPIAAGFILAILVPLL